MTGKPFSACTHCGESYFDHVQTAWSRKSFTFTRALDRGEPSLLGEGAPSRVAVAPGRECPKWRDAA